MILIFIISATLKEQRLGWDRVTTNWPKPLKGNQHQGQRQSGGCVKLAMERRRSLRMKRLQKSYT